LSVVNSTVYEAQFTQKSHSNQATFCWSVQQIYITNFKKKKKKLSAWGTCSSHTQNFQICGKCDRLRPDSNSLR